jgi:hypothetical protein
MKQNLLLVPFIRLCFVVILVLYICTVAAFSLSPPSCLSCVFVFPSSFLLLKLLLLIIGVHWFLVVGLALDSCQTDVLDLEPSCAVSLHVAKVKRSHLLLLVWLDLLT